MGRRMAVHPVAFVAISKVSALVPAGAPGILLVALEAPAVLPASACRIVLAAIRLGFANLTVFFEQCILSVAVAVCRPQSGNGNAIVPALEYRDSPESF